MENLKPHVHNGTDAQKLRFNEAIENAPQEALTTGTSSTAGATYTTTNKI